MLSNSDARTIRHSAHALGLLIAGAVHYLETQYGPEANPDRSEAISHLFKVLRQELNGWEVD